MVDSINSFDWTSYMQKEMPEWTKANTSLFISQAYKGLENQIDHDKAEQKKASDQLKESETQ